MPLIEYRSYRPNKASQTIVSLANNILDEYVCQGYSLTLRQLFYQFVARDVLPNSEKSYKNLGTVISRAREAGLIDWRFITDRGRQVSALPHWDDGGHFLASVCSQFNLDLWVDQTVRCEVWVEKDTLSQICEQAAGPFAVPVMANRGYMSSSAVWEAAHDRFLKSDCNQWVIVHLGDHDPSGLDMTRDLRERLNLYSSCYGEENDLQETKVTIDRIALNMDQIEELSPPPNPAKVTDARFAAYVDEFGDESWELDAIEPGRLVQMIQDRISSVMTNHDAFENRKEEQMRIRQRLSRVSLDDQDAA